MTDKVEVTFSGVEATAKTIVQLRREHDEWIKVFRRGAMGDQEAYAKARDTRAYFEENGWTSEAEFVRLKTTLQEFATEIENLRRHNHYDSEKDVWLVPQKQLFALEKSFKQFVGCGGQQHDLFAEKAQPKNEAKQK